jgi:hypothetical protein
MSAGRDLHRDAQAAVRPSEWRATARLIAALQTCLACGGAAPGHAVRPLAGARRRSHRRHRPQTSASQPAPPRRSGAHQRQVHTAVRESEPQLRPQPSSWPPCDGMAPRRGQRAHCERKNGDVPSWRSDTHWHTSTVMQRPDGTAEIVRNGRWGPRWRVCDSRVFSPVPWSAVTQHHRPPPPPSPWAHPWATWRRRPPWRPAPWPPA